MKQHQSSSSRRVKRSAGARQSLAGAKRRIAWHLYQARHDQCEALTWAHHDFDALVERLTDMSRSALSVLERAEALSGKYHRLAGEAAPRLAATEALWDEAQAEALAAGLPDDEDEQNFRAAIAQLRDEREIRLALSALERLRPRARAAAVASVG